MIHRHLLAAVLLAGCGPEFPFIEPVVNGQQNTNGMGTQTTTTTGQTSQTGGGNTGPTSPNYAANGFVATEDNAFAVLTVIEMDADGFTKSYQSGSPTDLDVRYVPGSGVQIYSEGQAFDGTTDAESRNFNGSGKEFGGSAPNLARIQTGAWTYALDGQIDQKDGRFRHVIAIADGITYAPPVSGFGFYDGELGATLEVFENGSYTTTPIVAEGGMTVDFADSEVSGLFELDAGRSNGLTGTIASGVGNLSPSGSFDQYGNAGITQQGRYIYTEGTIAGAIAGPNAEETYGLVSFGSTNGSSYTAALVGSFLGNDVDR